MKKKISLFIMIGLLFSGLTGHAQDNEEKTAKDPQSLKPVAGDFAIGTDLMPYINFAGNFFGKDNDNDLNLSETTLFGKYMLTDNSAVRVAFYASNYTDIDNYYVQDDFAIATEPTSTAQVIDTRTQKYSNTTISAGYEMRKDRDRFVFLYGGNIRYSYVRNKYEYEYGNPMGELNNTPTIYSTSLYNGNARLLNTDSGITQTIGIGGFAGIEFFIAKKLAFGADFSINYSINWGSQADSKYEEWDGSQIHVFERPSSPGNSRRALTTSQYGSYVGAGQIYIHFYF